MRLPQDWLHCHVFQCSARHLRSRTQQLRTANPNHRTYRGFADLCPRRRRARHRRCSVPSWPTEWKRISLFRQQTRRKNVSTHLDRDGRRVWHDHATAHQLIRHRDARCRRESAVRRNMRVESAPRSENHHRGCTKIVQAISTLIIYSDTRAKLVPALAHAQRGLQEHEHHKATFSRGRWTDNSNRRTELSVPSCRAVLLKPCGRRHPQTDITRCAR